MDEPAYSEGGAIFKKLEIVRCFILDYSSFLKFLCISKKKIKKNTKKNLKANPVRPLKKKKSILRQCYNDPTRPLKILRGTNITSPPGR